MRHFGVCARGLRLPVVKQGDDLATIISDCFDKAVSEENIAINDGDIIGITESVLARSQGNYATSAALSQDIKAKTGGDVLGVVFPIMSRNRFLGILKAISKAARRIIVVLSYPQDEVGNALFDADLLEQHSINPLVDVFKEDELRKLLNVPFTHPFTGIDYPSIYRSVADNVEIIFSNRPEAVLEYTDTVIAADIHSRFKTKRRLKQKGARIVLGLDDLLTRSVDGSGYNETYGVLGSNFANDNVLKLFPRNGQPFVDGIQQRLFEKYGKRVEVLVYGDGAFKDPVGHIWEQADPVVAPFYTKGLLGVPYELKFKYLSDTKFAHMSSSEASKAMKRYVKENANREVTSTEALGTTPRRITDLIGSLCDLVSGSGDKGTPVIYIQGYFDKYGDE